MLRVPSSWYRFARRSLETIDAGLYDLDDFVRSFLVCTKLPSLPFFGVFEHLLQDQIS